jgi:hypothetical protein
MPVDYARLQTELTTDPRGYGFRQHIIVAEGGTNAGLATNNSVLTTMMNLSRDGSNPPSNPTADGGQADGRIPIRREQISSQEVWEAINMADMTVLPATPTEAQLSLERRNLAWLSGLAAIPQVRLLNDDGSNTPVITNLSTIFPSGTPTRDRLIAISTRYGSRAEELFGKATVLTHTDISTALRG